MFYTPTPAQTPGRKGSGVRTLGGTDSLGVQHDQQSCVSLRGMGIYHSLCRHFSPGVWETLYCEGSSKTYFPGNPWAPCPRLRPPGPVFPGVESRACGGPDTRGGPRGHRVGPGHPCRRGRSEATSHDSWSFSSLSARRPRPRALRTGVGWTRSPTLRDGEGWYKVGPDDSPLEGRRWTSWHPVLWGRRGRGGCPVGLGSDSVGLPTRSSEWVEKPQVPVPVGVPLSRVAPEPYETHALHLDLAVRDIPASTPQCPRGTREGVSGLTDCEDKFFGCTPSLRPRRQVDTLPSVQ